MNEARKSREVIYRERQIAAHAIAREQYQTANINAMRQSEPVHYYAESTAADPYECSMAKCNVESARS